MHNWDDYRLILAMGRTGTVRGAAQQLGINHATVSRRLAHLQGDGAPTMFKRISGSYQATATGRLLIQAAEKIEAISLATGQHHTAKVAELAGTIRLSLSTTMAQSLLLDELAAFSRKYPFIELSVDTTLHFTDLAHKDHTHSSEADVFIRALEKPDDHLVGQRLFPYALCCYCSRSYLQATPACDRRWLRYAGSTDSLNWIARSPQPNAPVGMTIDNLVVLQRAAAAGHGMIRTACFIGDTDPELIRLPGAVPEARRDLWVLTRPDLKHTPRVRRLTEFLISALEAKRDLIVGR